MAEDKEKTVEISVGLLNALLGYATQAALHEKDCAKYSKSLNDEQRRDCMEHATKIHQDCTEALLILRPGRKAMAKRLVVSLAISGREVKAVDSYIKEVCSDVPEPKVPKYLVMFRSNYGSWRGEGWFYDKNQYGIFPNLERAISLIETTDTVEALVVVDGKPFAHYCLKQWLDHPDRARS